MALGKRGKTEHAGAKNGGGGRWGYRADVKAASDKERRRRTKQQIQTERFGREADLSDQVD